jgi:hypothetical protein
VFGIGFGLLVVALVWVVIARLDIVVVVPGWLISYSALKIVQFAEVGIVK